LWHERRRSRRGTVVRACSKDGVGGVRSHLDSLTDVLTAAKLSDAADVIRRNPVTIQLRYLQTLLEIGGEQDSTVVFPLPIDLLKPLLEARQSPAGPDAVPLIRATATTG